MKTTRIAFILTMPGNNSWNGKWTGDGKLYCRVRKFSRRENADKILVKKHYGYNFGDGWYASIEVREVDAKEAREAEKYSQGFYGYDWMIDRIISYGKIIADHQLEKA